MAKKEHPDSEGMWGAEDVTATLTEDEKKQKKDFEDSIDIQEVDYGDVGDEDSAEGDDNSADKAEDSEGAGKSSDKKGPADDGFDPHLLAKAELLGISQSEAKADFTPRGLRKWVVAQEQMRQAGSQDKGKKDETEEEDDEKELESFALELPEDQFDADQIKALNEAIKKPIGKMFKEVKGLRKKLTEAEEQVVRERILAEQQSFDEEIQKLDNEELFGEGYANDLDPKSEQFENRSDVWDAIRVMKGRGNSLPTSRLVSKAARIVFADKLKNKAEQKRQRDEKIEDRREKASTPPQHKKDQELPPGRERALRNMYKRSREGRIAR